MAIVLLAGSGLCTPARAQCRYGPASPRLPVGLKLTIRAQKPVAEMSRPLIIYVELSNESNTPIQMRDNLAASLNYELHVRDASGKEAPLTEGQRQVRTGPRHGSGYDVTLAPGEKDTDQENLSNIYNISVPGRYTVEACREIHDWGNIYSNKIVVPFVTAAPEAK
jgi:hypothetical protein